MPQEHVVKWEQHDEEEAELNHKGQIEFCPGTLWEGVKKLTREAERRYVHSLGG